ncbi:LysR family transcriptional regulator [Brevibacillus ruminantium]|uniref:LysR family transcriptional regulator n=1 Tax=Brevibacillus ruminantium TaxID=2950604 RepID=A0ABY4WL65_9BACL|nr:LysR family transcriptional regulator [Brevibacillus ruminantium]USG67872.1 LysR family transcriptional regulator [Brevibacillus ruminantium]
MNIQNIKAFIYVVQFGSFNKAAEALYLSQPSISARIRSLENDVAQKLFVRDRNKCVLTDAGKSFLPYAEKILREYQESVYKMNQQLHIPDQVKIACSISISNYVIPIILPVLQQQFPACRFKIVSDHSESSLSKVLNHEVDCGLIRELMHPRIESKVLMKFPVGLYAHRDHPLAQKETSVSIEQLADHNIIFYDHNSPEWLGITNLLEKVNFQQHLLVDIDNMEAAKRLVMKGIGICFLPENAVEDEVQNQRMKKIPLTLPHEFQTSIALVHVKDATISTIVSYIKKMFE